MNIGTKSVLFGVHCFFLHPIFVFMAWWKLYGFPYDPRLWVAFIVHDLGYWGKPNMDGDEGEQHPYLGARIMHKLFDKRGKRWSVDDADDDCMRWHDFTLYHSRFLAKAHGANYSRLCVADKYAICLEPSWLYLPRAIASGEIKEYMKDAEVNSNGAIKVQRSRLVWHKGVKDYVRKWVAEHKDLKPDTWTTANRAKADANGVWH